MADSVLVRAARADDLPAVSRISVAAYEAAGQLEQGSRYREVLADAQTRFRDGHLLVAERSGEVIGTVTICLPGTDLAEIGGPGELEFRFLAVDPMAWGSGVADALVLACEEQARITGAASLAICVRDNNTGAAAMYAKRGFVRAPERDWSPVPGTDLLALTRPVTSER